VAAAILAALAKLPADRSPSAAAFATALEGGPGMMARSQSVRRGGTVSGRWARIARILWPAAFAFAAGAAAWGWMRSMPEQIPSRLSITDPGLGGAGSFLQRMLAISPDGRTLLYVTNVDGESRLVRRRLEDDSATALPRMQSAFSGPVISPDGREFIAASRVGTQMFRFPIEGGDGKPLPRNVPWSWIAAWGGDGSLWLTPQSGNLGVTRLTPNGEVLRPFGPDLASLTVNQILPGDRYALTVRAPAGTMFGPPSVLDLKAGTTTPILDFDVVEMRYAAGLLIYVLNSGALEAVRFDLRTRRVTGAPVQIARDVSLTGAGTAHFSVASNGTVAYVPESPRSLVLMDRSGSARSAVSEGRNYHIPRFSPDGKHLLTDFTTADGRDVWRLDLASGAMSRVTFDRDGHDATWEPDGKRVTYISATRSGGALSIYRAQPGRNSQVDSLISSPTIAYTGVWLPDGSALVTAGSDLRGDSHGDIAIIRKGGRGPIEPLVASRFEESFPAVSHDGRWLAYSSDETGTTEVYVLPLDREGDVVPVSIGGGNEPVWGPGDRELFYRAPRANASKLVAATMDLGATAKVTARRELFDVSAMSTTTPHANYDIAPDGRTFAMVRQNPATRIVVIQNLPAIVAQLERGARR
jgi:TolB protein